VVGARGTGTNRQMGGTMRLEYLCDVDWGYREEEAFGGKFVRLRPYGTDEGPGMGVLVGEVSGDRLRGALTCVNHPRVRSDGVACPDIHGVIRTEEGVPIICSFQGHTLFSDPRGEAILRVTFAAEAEHYRWLNNAFCIYEGVVNPRPRGRIYVCLHELT
jgi:hypothetical protein